MSLVQPHVIWDASQLPPVDIPKPASAKPEKRDGFSPYRGLIGQVRFAIILGDSNCLGGRLPTSFSVVNWMPSIPAAGYPCITLVG
ncbi:hypothetical protein [Acaryochloris sp. CCMEE 5410]|uniref:hypothetical protein n=1 Tax=Acaryochloris sp. CCMEE 5410 TaxID=310037 RepID=UPI0021D0A575|nr:hypothetical protein [Acaryochloris sp. CCMEE 5410]